MISSAGNMLKFTERSPLPLVISRPLKLVLLRKAPRPRIEISDAPVLSRVEAAPVSVSIASASDGAGRSPMSSADNTSAITVSSRFLLIELCIDSRMPVTWTWSRVVASCPEPLPADCACTAGEAASAASSATISGVGDNGVRRTTPAGCRMVFLLPKDRPDGRRGTQLRHADTEMSTNWTGFFVIPLIQTDCPAFHVLMQHDFARNVAYNTPTKWYAHPLRNRGIAVSGSTSCAFNRLRTAFRNPPLDIAWQLDWQPA
ncbi:hypothetical protein BN1263500029 [Stenotrophomonas indicatrix]|nr:hypothetical protein BN1263500029 [Stenotrophomonas indicatrix]